MKDKLIEQVNKRYSIYTGLPVCKDKDQDILVEHQMKVYKVINNITEVVEQETAIYSAALKFADLADTDAQKTHMEIEQAKQIDEQETNMQLQ